MAARQEAARRKRLLQARIGAAVAGVLVVAAIVWIVAATGGGDSEPTANPSSGPTACEWIDEFPDATASPSPSPLPSGVKNVGTPPTDVPRSGFQVVTFNTNLGVVKVEMDLSKTPCTAASIAHLASRKFYDGSSCHRLVASIFALQCGDPSGTGTGGATYRFADENLPSGKLPAYHEGDVAMANTGQPGTNGSQFFFLWANSQLQGDYSLFGRVIQGMELIKKVAAGGDDGAFEAQAGGGHPKTKFTFKSVTVGPVTAEPAPTPTAAPTPSATPASTTAPASPSPSS